MNSPGLLRSSVIGAAPCFAASTLIRLGGGHRESPELAIGLNASLEIAQQLWVLAPKCLQRPIDVVHERPFGIGNLSIHLGSRLKLSEFSTHQTRAVECVQVTLQSVSVQK